MSEDSPYVPKPPRHAAAPTVPPPAHPAEPVAQSLPVDSALPAPTAASPADALGAPRPDLKEQVIEVLQRVFDPEIPVNIYDLGLVYGIDVTGTGEVVVTMTLTSPACPVAESLPPEVETKVKAIDGVTSSKVNLVWEPPWGKHLLSEAARLQLGMD